MTKDKVMAEILKIRTGAMTVEESQKEIRDLLDREYPESKEITVKEICDLLDRSTGVKSVIFYADGSCALRNELESIKSAFNNGSELKSFLVESQTPPIPQPEDNADDVCGNCRFYAESLLYKGTIGVCRRHAPVYVPPNGNIPPPAPAFPPMDRNDWCGDWEKKEGL